MASRSVGAVGAKGTTLIQTQPVGGFHQVAVTAGHPASLQTRPEEAATTQAPGSAVSDELEPAVASETDVERGADVEDLVDKVLRKLMRRLAIEGERRGWQRWP